MMSDSILPKGDAKTVVPVSLAFLVAIAYGSYRLGTEKSSVELLHVQTQQLRALETLTIAIERLENNQGETSKAVHSLDTRMHLLSGELQVIGSKVDKK